MATRKKQTITLRCAECKRPNYFTNKTKQMVEEKIELKKFCKKCRKHTIHKESKK